MSLSAHLRVPYLLLALLAMAAGLSCAHEPSAKQRESADIHYQLGAEAMRSGRREDALHEFDEALKIDDRLVLAHLGRGIALQFLGRLDEAEREYRRAIEIDPKQSDAHNALGQLLAQTQRLEPALAEFDRALEDPTYRDAYLARCNKGEALYSLGRASEALRELKTCLTLAPRYCRGHRELGQIELKEGRARDALASFHRYSELCANSADAWFELGLAQMKVGDPEEARKAFERCAELPDDPVVEECKDKAGALR